MSDLSLPITLVKAAPTLLGLLNKVRNPPIVVRVADHYPQHDSEDGKVMRVTVFNSSDVARTVSPVQLKCEGWKENNRQVCFAPQRDDGRNNGEVRIEPHASHVVDIPYAELHLIRRGFKEFKEFAGEARWRPFVESGGKSYSAQHAILLGTGTNERFRP